MTRPLHSVWIAAALAACASSAWTSPCAEPRPAVGAFAAAALVALLWCTGESRRRSWLEAAAAVALGVAIQCTLAPLLAHGVDLPLVSHGAARLLAADLAGSTVPGGFGVKGLDGSLWFRGIGAKALLPEIATTLAVAALLSASARQPANWAAFHVTAAAFAGLAVLRVALLAAGLATTRELLSAADPTRLGVFWSVPAAPGALLAMALLAPLAAAVRGKEARS